MDIQNVVRIGSLLQVGGASAALTYKEDRIDMEAMGVENFLEDMIPISDELYNWVCYPICVDEVVHGED